MPYRMSHGYRRSCQIVDEVITALIGRMIIITSFVLGLRSG